MHDEYELKLSVPKKYLSALEHHVLIHAATREKKKHSRLVTTYFDTPESALRKRGMALRVRRSGRRRVQTLKAAADDTGSAHHHREYESEIKGDRPDISLIHPPRIRRFLNRNKLDRSLTPVFTTDIERDCIPLQFADSNIELALDVGRISTGDDEQEICEAELELTSGRRAGIIELALALCDEVPFRLESRTKAARGYVMSKREVPQPVRAAPVALKAKMSVGDAFEAVIRSTVEQLRANEAAFVETAHPEAVHQMRVAVRRLRATLGMFGRALDDEARTYLAGELKWLQQALGPARDWDVFITETLDPAASKLDVGDEVAAMRKAAHSLRNDAYRRVRRTLGVRRYTRALLCIELWMTDHTWLKPGMRRNRRGVGKIKPYAKRLLNRWDTKIRTRMARHQELTPAELHAVRIRAKKLRYAAEFVEGVFPKTNVRDCIANLKSLQDVLGIANDLVIAERLLGQLSERMEKNGETPVQIAGAVGAIHGWLAAHQHDNAGQQRGIVEHCLKSERFWA